MFGIGFPLRVRAGRCAGRAAPPAWRQALAPAWMRRGPSRPATTAGGPMHRRSLLALPGARRRTLACPAAGGRYPARPRGRRVRLDRRGRVPPAAGRLCRGAFASRRALGHRQPAARRHRGRHGRMGLARRGGDGGRLHAGRRCRRRPGAGRGGDGCAAQRAVLERDRRCARPLRAACCWRRPSARRSGSSTSRATPRPALAAPGHGGARRCGGGRRHPGQRAGRRRGRAGDPLRRAAGRDLPAGGDRRAGAFVVAAEDRRDIARALRAKLVREIA